MMSASEKRDQIASNRPPVSVEAASAQLARVVASPPFERSPRMQALLTFLVQEVLAGRGALIKEYVIAVSVFGRPEDFDPSTSAVVRVEAGRLRRLLAQYYAEYGSEDPLRFAIPKGGYAPVFEAPTRDNPLPTTPDPTGNAPEANSAWAAPAERRLVTVVSCALAEDRISLATDQTDFLAAFDTFYSLCSAVAERHGGALDAGSSDRVVIYFGWPDLMEDAAGRALTAALELLSNTRDALGAAGRGVQIGVASSEVVLRPAGQAVATVPEIVGRAPALATKLLNQAPLNGVLVSELTRRMTGSSFEFVAASINSDDDADLTPIWRPLRARPEVTRFQAVVAGHSSLLVGRQEELALLASRWRLSEEGEGQAVLLTAEPGMGKSRLAEAFVAAVGDSGVIKRVQCSPHHCNTALYPWINFIQAEMGIPPEAQPADSDITAFLNAKTLDDDKNAEVLAALLSVGTSERDESLPRRRQKDLTLELLSRIVLAAGAAQPLLLLVEDIHWADPTTMEFLHELLRKAAELNVMLLMTSRLDALTASFRETVITTVRLSRLSRAQSLALVDGLSVSTSLSCAARTMISEKAEGIPLFIEEITKLALAGGDQVGTQPVPDRLSDVLTGQFSRLGKARSIAQIASVIGREFSNRMLQAVAGDSLSAVEACVDQLVAAGVVIRRAGNGRSDEFAFRHALLRDAAYASLLPSARRELHSRTAEALIEYLPEIASEQPEIVAAHFSEGGLPSEAVPFWLDAGRKAARTYAMSEAAALLRQSLQTLALLPPSRERSELELQILIDLGSAVRSAQGYRDDELHAIYDAARALALELEKPDALANAVYGLWTHAAGRSEWPTASVLADEFQALTNTIEHDGQYDVEAARLIGAGEAFRGHFGLARQHFERAMRIYDDRAHGPVLGFDPGAVSAAYLSWTLWHLGDREAAELAAQRALKIAETKQHPPTLAMVLSWLTFHAMCEENLQRVHDFSRRLQAVCDERECRYWQAFGAAASDWACFQQEPSDTYIASFLTNVDKFHEQYLNSCLYLLGAQMAGKVQQVEQGLQLVDLAREFRETHDERIWEAEEYRIQAELLLKTANVSPAKIEALLRKSISTAEKQGAILFRGRAEAMLVAVIQGAVAGQESAGKLGPSYRKLLVR